VDTCTMLVWTCLKVSQTWSHLPWTSWTLI
jgi:hypothetical protein